jgi:outer membrane protein assembly factor BamD (BamD/ComL family)
MKIKHALFPMAVGLGLFWGCSGEDARRLFETAQLEERQNNRDHAMQLYEELLHTYPESPYAQRSKERLRELKGSQ